MTRTLSTIAPAIALCGALLCASGAWAQAQDPASSPLPLASADVRATSNGVLQQTLYDLQSLRQNTHQAHWNVIGSDFYQLHEFYGELYTGLEPFIDRVAERMRALGAPADGRPGEIAQATSIEAITEGDLRGETTNGFLMGNWKTMSDTLYDGIDKTEEDMVTQDLLISVAHFVDKGLWQLRAHTL